MGQTGWAQADDEVAGQTSGRRQGDTAGQVGVVSQAAQAGQAVRAGRVGQFLEDAGFSLVDGAYVNEQAIHTHGMKATRAPTTSHVTSHGTSHDTSHGTSHSISHDTSHSTSHSISHRISHGTSHSTSHGSADGCGLRPARSEEQPTCSDPIAHQDGGSASATAAVDPGDPGEVLHTILDPGQGLVVLHTPGSAGLPLAAPLLSPDLFLPKPPHYPTQAPATRIAPSSHTPAHGPPPSPAHGHHRLRFRCPVTALEGDLLWRGCIAVRDTGTPKVRCLTTTPQDQQDG